MLVSEAKALPIEIVVRGYITGSTSTSLWTMYERGMRKIYGIKFPDSLKKHQKLKKPVITPTTRETSPSGHDEPITKQGILKQKLIPSKIYNQIEKIALALFERGTKIAAKAGFILADTKYEFGLDKKGKLILIDEIHTPDSSRFWVKETYKQNLKKGKDPENFDKEFLRLWFKKKGYSGEGIPPKMPKNFINKVSKRYIQVYEKIVGKKFNFNLSTNIEQRIKNNFSKN
jgi:phosphoribosylaminoimidazole-succinocarboxamide synthase